MTFFLPRDEGRRIPGPEGITVKAGADDTGGVVAVLESTSAPGFGPPRHIHHGSDELFYILGGELDGLIDEIVALAAELGGPRDPDDPRIQAIVERYDSSFVGPPLGAR